MLDLYLGLAIVVVASAGIGWAGLLLSRRIPRHLSMAVMIVIGIVIWAWRRDSDRLWLAGMLPLSNLVIVGNVTLPGAALVAGMAFGMMTGPVARRVALLTPLIVVAGFDLVHPLFGRPPVLGNRWENHVCRQTSPYSCSPAAAATLLRHFGIETSERDMANLCLTSGGTSSAGLYRGLKLKTAGRGIAPRAFHRSVEELRQSFDSPVLLSVGLEQSETADPRYEQLWGWSPGVRHTIVLLRFLPNDRMEVADPSTGREIWTIKDLRVLWHGNGIAMVRTAPSIN